MSGLAPAGPAVTAGQRPVPGRTAPSHGRRAASGRAARLPGLRARLVRGGTPAVLRALLAGLVVLAAGWGAVAARTVGQHASAASEVVSSSEPLSLAAQQMYQSLSDADVTATAAFLAGPPEPLTVRQRYEADVAHAAAGLAVLRSSDAAGSGALAASLSAISTALPVYTGYVQQAQTYSSLGYPLTGGSFMQVASEEMHLRLLPAARASYTFETSALTAASARATGLPQVVVVLVLAVAIGVALARSQRWLRRRTHRMLNYGLATATAAMLVAVLWLAVAFGSARSDLERGLGHGSVPAETLAQASIAAAQARGDQVLNLISRSGSSSFQQDFTAIRHQIGPGAGGLLNAAAASADGRAVASVAAAERDAVRWYAATGKVFSLDLAASYAAETRLVIGAGQDGSAAGFARLDADIRRAIGADQAVFASSAATGRAAFGGLETGIIVAAVAMAAGIAWGLSRRIAEYP